MQSRQLVNKTDVSLFFPSSDKAHHPTCRRNILKKVLPNSTESLAPLCNKRTLTDEPKGIIMSRQLCVDLNKQDFSKKSLTLLLK